jgi:hypothetical protein
MTPEHAKRLDQGQFADIDAAYDYVTSVMHTGDARICGAPAWHGWALREAFLAGCSHAAKAPKEMK